MENWLNSLISRAGEGDFLYRHFEVGNSANKKIHVYSHFPGRKLLGGTGVLLSYKNLSWN